MGNLEGIENVPGGRLFLWCASTASNIGQNPLVGIAQLAVSPVVVPILIVETMGRGLLQRFLGGGSGENRRSRSISPPRAEESKWVAYGEEILEGVFLVSGGGPDVEVDIVFLTERDRSPRPWTIVENGNARFWPRESLPEDLPAARILEVCHADKKRTRPWDTAICIVNSLASRDVGVGSRPFFLVSSDASNIVVAHMLVRDTMRPLLPACKGVAMFGDTNHPADVGRVAHDYGVQEKSLNTVTFCTKSEIGPLCSSKTIRVLQEPWAGPPSSDRNADPTYRELVSFLRPRPGEHETGSAPQQEVRFAGVVTNVEFFGP